MFFYPKDDNKVHELKDQRDDLIQKYVRREMLMNSPIYNEWIKEEREETAKATAKETTKSNIMQILEVKFNFIPGAIKEVIEEIGDIGTLEVLLRKSIQVSSIGEFEALLNQARALSGS